MDLKGYMSELYKSRSWQTELSDSALMLLSLFGENEYTSTYQIYKYLLSIGTIIAYKNVRKKIQRLLSLKLIKERMEPGKHGSKYFRLTISGVFYLSSFRAQQAEVVPTILKNYSNDPLFTIFLYPFIQGRTLSDLEWQDTYGIFIKYLNDCCKEIKWDLEGAEKCDKGEHIKQHICFWQEIPGEKSGPKLASTLYDRFKISWLSENPLIEKTNINTIKISDRKSQNKLFMVLNASKKKAILTDGKNTLHTFTVRRFIDYMRKYQVVELDSMTSGHYLQDAYERIHDILPDMFESVMFSLVKEYHRLIDLFEESPDHQYIAGALRNDLELLARDKKFLNMLKMLNLNFLEYRNDLLSKLAKTDSALEGYDLYDMIVEMQSQV